MNQMTKDFRNNIAQLFIKSLEENQLNWKKSWSSLNSLPENAITGASYKGVNRFYLTFLCDMNGWEDPRFATFKQILDAKWHLKKGSKGVKVEYWMPYDKELKKVVPWSQVSSIQENDKIGLVAKYYTVFNAKDIEGILPMKMPEKRDIKPDKIIDTICKNMNIEIKNDGKDRAFYSIAEDRIHLPKKEFFHSDYAYNSVAMHELGHSTGAEHRLNRNIRNVFGSEDYAFEELVAEITSTFMSKDLASCMEPYEMDNHKAYIQSWISKIKEKPDILMLAIKEANKAADYLERAAELITEKDLKKNQEEIISVDADKIINPEIVAAKENTYLRIQEHFSNIVSNAIGDIEKRDSEWGAWFGRIVNEQSPQNYFDIDITGVEKTHQLLISIDAVKGNQIVDSKAYVYSIDFSNWKTSLLEANEEICTEFNGFFKETVNTEKIEISQNVGLYSPFTSKTMELHYEELNKLGYDAFPTDENMIKNEIVRDIKKSGFKPSRNMVDNIMKLWAETGEKCTLKDISKLSKSDELNEGMKELVDKIARECQSQELALCR